MGLVALDASGNMSGAVTTSGMAFKIHGRVGDSPIIGAGLFVDNEVGAATSTGVGEEVIRVFAEPTLSLNLCARVILRKLPAVKLLSEL